MRGAYEKHPERRAERAGEPDLPLGVGEPPAKFDAGQQEAFAELATCGVAWFTVVYRPPLIQAALLLAKSWRGELSAAEGARYDKLLTALGFGVTNTKVKVPSAKAESKLSKFA